MNNRQKLVEVKDLKKTFLVGGQEINVLKGISMDVDQGDFAVIFGPSGCGKSTLLHTILGMEAPSSGTVQIDGKDIYQMEEDEMVKYRKEKIGVVFQQSIWIKSLNVLENVSFPNRLRGMNRDEAEKKALEALEIVKLQDWASHHPSELSSGQQQRVSLARALTTDPLIIVADEPTGNLDTVTGDELMNLLMELNKEKGKTLLMVTHDLEYLRYASRLFHIIDGLKVEESDNAGAEKLMAGLRTKKGERKATTVNDKNYLAENAKDYSKN